MAGIKINPIKELYLAKNIEDLQKQMKIRLGAPGQNYDILIRVSQEVWKTAKESENNGDQEKAYVCFFKYCDLAYRIRNSPQYKKDKLYYDCTVSSKSVREAFDHSKTLLVELKNRYDERQTKQDQIQYNKIITRKSKFEKEKEVNEKWQTNFSFINKLMKCSEIFSDFSPLERAFIRVQKQLIISEDQNSKLDRKNYVLKESLKIFGDQNAFDLFKCELQDQNSKLEQENGGLQESLKIFGDQNLKLEQRIQDLQDPRLCKICMDHEVSQVFNPCNHVICCNNCINKIQICPICRKNIESSQMIYFS